MFLFQDILAGQSRSIERRAAATTGRGKCLGASIGRLPLPIAAIAAAVLVGTAVLMALANASAANPPAPGSTTSSGLTNEVKPCTPQMACGVASKGFPDIGKAGAIRAICPKESMTVAQLDGISGNPWRKLTHAEFLDEASHCPNIHTIYQSANGSESAYVSDLNSLVSQGVDVIVTYDDFGAAALPAIRAAFKAGVAIVPYASPPTTEPQAGVDYTAFVTQDTFDAGREDGLFLNRALPNGGNLIYIGGSPGNLLDPVFLKGFHSVANSNLNLLESVTGKWTIAGNQTAVQPLLSKYSKIDAMFTSYTATAAGAVQAFLNANRKVPMLAGLSPDMQNVCQYHKIHQTDPSFQLFSTSADQQYVRIALRVGVAAAQNIKDIADDWAPNQGKASISIKNPVLIDTLKGKTPDCNPNVPPGTSLSSDLLLSEVLKVLR